MTTRGSSVKQSDRLKQERRVVWICIIGILALIALSAYLQ